MWQKRPLERRQILQMGVVGIGALLASCSGAANGASSGGSTNSGGSGSGVCVAEIPEETAGPYPADGSSGGPGGPPPGDSPPSSVSVAQSDGVNVLTRSGIVSERP